MFSVGILTVSDKGAVGTRVDESGRLLHRLVTPLPATVVAYEIVPDEQAVIRDRLMAWCDMQRMDLIVTTGGTGPSPRDVTPDATLTVIERQVPGLGEIMRMEGYKKNPHAILSRAVCGIRGATLIINLPGSPRAVSENFEIILPVLPHLLSKMKGDLRDCATVRQG
jgi:molybdenum cofactor synthesis domain-containing protein